MTCSFSTQESPEIKIPEGVKGYFTLGSIRKGGNIFNQIQFIGQNRKILWCSEKFSAPTGHVDFLRAGLKVAQIIHEANKGLRRLKKYQRSNGQINDRLHTTQRRSQ